jgi:hypothetical protein
MSNQAIIILFFVFSSLLSAHETFAQDFQRAPSRMENNIDRFGALTDPLGTTITITKLTT